MPEFWGTNIYTNEPTQFRDIQQNNQSLQGDGNGTYHYMNNLGGAVHTNALIKHHLAPMCGILEQIFILSLAADLSTNHMFSALLNIY